MVALIYFEDVEGFMVEVKLKLDTLVAERVAISGIEGVEGGLLVDQESPEIELTSKQADQVLASVHGFLFTVVSKKSAKAKKETVETVKIEPEVPVEPVAAEEPVVAEEPAPVPEPKTVDAPVEGAV